MELIQERPLGANIHTLPGAGHTVTVQKLHLPDFGLVWTEEKHVQLPDRDMKPFAFLSYMSVRSWTLYTSAKKTHERLKAAVNLSAQLS